MNPIISNLPDKNFHQKKLLLNEEFHTKSKIKGLVSYIYYPTQSEFPHLGHAELEIEGYSYTLMYSSNFKVRLLSNMIRSSESENGLPFFRFHISVTPNQLKDLREINPNTWGPLCGMGVAKALSMQGKYTIPLPVTISPFVSAIYLTCVKALGSQRISSIELHGGKNRMMNLASITGVTLECLGIISAINVTADHFNYFY